MSLQPVSNNLIPKGVTFGLQKNHPVFGQGAKNQTEKKEFPWKKAGIIGAVAVAATIFIMTRNPTRKKMAKQYSDVFLSRGQETREFTNLPKRSEVIINTAVNGSPRANELLRDLELDNEAEIMRTLRVRNKIKRLDGYYAEGRLIRGTSKITPEQAIRKESKHRKKLVDKFLSLYEKNIKPLIN